MGTEGSKALKCKDCGVVRKTVHRPGPRCVTCMKVFKEERKEKDWGRRILRTYGITPKQYWDLYEKQGGVCAVCQRATGKAKRLAVDHDHQTGIVRGLLCGPCNKDVVGRVYDEETALRLVAYFCNPPSRRLLDMVVYVPK